MGKRIFQFFRIWGNLVIALITIYSFAVTYFVSSPTQQRELTNLFGWSWQTWLIILLVSIILTRLIQDLFEKYEKKESEKFMGEDSTIHSSAEDGSNAFSIGNLHAERVSITQGSNPKIIEDDNLQIRIKIHSDTSSPYGRILYLTVYNESQGDIEDYEV